MTYDDVMSELRALGDAKVRSLNVRNGAGDNQFGVKMGSLRDLAKRIKVDHELGMQLWNSGNIDAMFLATLVMNPKLLTVDDLDRMLGSLSYSYLTDWFGTNVIKVHPDKEAQRERWMNSKHEMTARMGWSLTAERIVKRPEGLNLDDLLDRLEREMSSAPIPVQWTMNYCLAEIGINFADRRSRAIEMGEEIGAFRDYPTSKGCTSPYAPIWITAMVNRKG